MLLLICVFKDYLCCHPTLKVNLNVNNESSGNEHAQFKNPVLYKYPIWTGTDKEINSNIDTKILVYH